MLSIGAVLPFLAVLVEPTALDRFPMIIGGFVAFGWQSGKSLAIPAAFLLMFSAILAGGIRLLLSWFSTRLVLQIGHDIGLEIYSRMLHQTYARYVSRNTSEVISGIEKVQVVVFAVLLPAIQGVVAAFVALFIVSALIAIDPVTSIGSILLMAVIYIIGSIGARHILKRNAIVLAKAQTTRIQHVQEGCGGIRDIILDQSQAVFVERFRRLDIQFRSAQAVNAFIGTAPRFVVEAAGIMLIALVALYLSESPAGLVSALPTIGGMALGAQRVLPLFQQIYYGWSSTIGSKQILIDVNELRRAPINKTLLRDKTVPVKPLQGDIQFDDVSFEYIGSEVSALSAVNLHISKGQRVGFIGKTGSGKSTALDLLMGLLEPTAGTIRINGVPLNENNRSEWQANIAHVPQSIYIADASIAANIAFGIDASLIDESRVREAARKAKLAEFIEQLPAQYQTILGERGVRFSGGQRQRIGLARALYKEAQVLILDEATSALDESTERSVMQEIENLGRDITVVVIAHRLSTLSFCDRIFEVEKGRIQSSSTYQELLKAPS